MAIAEFLGKSAQIAKTSQLDIFQSNSNKLQRHSPRKRWVFCVCPVRTWWGPDTWLLLISVAHLFLVSSLSPASAPVCPLPVRPGQYYNEYRRYENLALQHNHGLIVSLTYSLTLSNQAFSRTQFLGFLWFFCSFAHPLFSSAIRFHRNLAPSHLPFFDFFVILNVL